MNAQRMRLTPTAIMASCWLIMGSRCPPDPPIADQDLRDAMTACGAGLSASSRHSIEAKVDAKFRAGSGALEVKRSLGAIFLESIPPEGRGEAFDRYIKCIEPRLKVNISRRLSGTISYSDGTPLERADFIVEGYGITGITNAQGRFDVPLPYGSEDSVKLVVQVQGARRDVSVPVAENQAIRLDIGPPRSTGLIPIGDSTFLDLSQRQSDWLTLSAWAHALRLERFGVLEDSFSPANPRAGRAAVLLLALPRQQRLSAATIHAVTSWVERGGGLLVMGHYAADVHHGSNPSHLTRQWGVMFDKNVLLPQSAAMCTRDHVFSPDLQYAVRGKPPPNSTHEVLRGVDSIMLVSSASLAVDDRVLQPELIIRTGRDTQICEAIPLQCAGEFDCTIAWRSASSGPATVVVAFRHGTGKVAIAGTWKILTLKHRATWRSFAT